MAIKNILLEVDYIFSLNLSELTQGHSKVH